MRVAATYEFGLGLVFGWVVGSCAMVRVSFVEQLEVVVGFCVYALWVCGGLVSDGNVGFVVRVLFGVCKVLGSSGDDADFGVVCGGDVFCGYLVVLVFADGDGFGIDKRGDGEEGDGMFCAVVDKEEMEVGGRIGKKMLYLYLYQASLNSADEDCGNTTMPIELVFGGESFASSYAFSVPCFSSRMLSLLSISLSCAWTELETIVWIVCVLKKVFKSGSWYQIDVNCSSIVELTRKI